MICLSTLLKLKQNGDNHFIYGRHSGLPYEAWRRFRRVGHRADRLNLSEVDNQISKLLAIFYFLKNVFFSSNNQRVNQNRILDYPLCPDKKSLRIYGWQPNNKLRPLTFNIMRFDAPPQTFNHLPDLPQPDSAAFFL